MRGLSLVKSIFQKYKESKTSHEFAIICDDSFSASHVELGKVMKKWKILRELFITIRLFIHRKAHLHSQCIDFPDV